MSTSTATDRPTQRCGPSGARTATPFLLAGDHDGAAPRPAVRIVLEPGDVPAESLRRPVRLELPDPESLSALSHALLGASARIPMLDGWTARVALRGNAVSILARGTTLVASSAAPAPSGWRRAVAAAGVVWTVFEIRSTSTPVVVAAARVPVQLV